MGIYFFCTQHLHCYTVRSLFCFVLIRYNHFSTPSFWHSRYLFTLLFITAVCCSLVFFFNFLYTLELFCHWYRRLLVRCHLALCSWMLPHQCDAFCQNLWLPAREVHHGEHSFFSCGSMAINYTLNNLWAHGGETTDPECWCSFCAGNVIQMLSVLMFGFSF